MIVNNFIAFQMWGPFRQQLIKSHTFYVDQAKKLLLSRFENIEEQANEEVDKWLEETSHLFDPDRDDLGDDYERANDVGIEFYELLSEMRDRTRLIVIAGMFHEWDKQLRDWLCREIQQWNLGDELRRQIWSVDFVELMELLKALRRDVTSTSYFPYLDACRLLVNVYKHGEGKSFEILRKQYPEYIENPLSAASDSAWALSLADYTNLNVTDTTLDRFSKAIIDFWSDVPENVFVPTIDEVPKWFERAYNRDRQKAG